MFVDDFSGVDDAIEGTGDYLDLAGMRRPSPGESTKAMGRTSPNEPRSRVPIRLRSFSENLSLSTSIVFAWEEEDQTGDGMSLVASTCLSDYTLAMKNAIDSKGLLVFILHRDGQEFSETCSPFEPSGRHAWVQRRCLCAVRR